MALAAIADILYKFYCFLHSLFTFLCYVGYLLYYIIYKAIWIVQNVTVFAQIVYEDNHHFIQDTKALIVGTSDFFIANIGKVCSGVSFVGTAFLNGTVAILSLLKLIVCSAKGSLVLIGDAVWMLVTMPYQLLLLFDKLLSDVNWFIVNVLKQIMRYFIEEIPIQSACGLLLLVLFFQNREPMKLMYNLMKERIQTGTEYLFEEFRTALLHVKLTRRTGRIETVSEGTQNQSTVGICIICQEHERTVAFIPCGHLCVCKGCARTLIYHNPRCPLCRTYINQKLEVYI